ncbi:MAG: hypothetical protein JSS56_23910 [Proteobacteria bacterium]|nr:hypothetical protein [Pseudomonadota bacterium]
MFLGALLREGSGFPPAKLAVFEDGQPALGARRNAFTKVGMSELFELQRAFALVRDASLLCQVRTQGLARGLDRHGRGV